MKFQEFNLLKSILKAVEQEGYEQPTPIQELAIPPVLEGKDVMGCAQTGTGKTAAFALPILNLLATGKSKKSTKGGPLVLVLTPTRELAAQVEESFRSYGRNTGIRTVAIFGGVSYLPQTRALRRAPQVLVATPGRLLDLINQRIVSLSEVEFFVLDEADRMLDMGFIPQVKRIVRATPRKEDRQTLLFSATFTQDIINLSQQWTYEPVSIDIEPEHVATDSVDQKVFLVSSEQRFRILKNMLRSDGADSVIVFANRRSQVRRLHEKLRKAGVSCGMLSGEVPQNKRTRTLEQFKNGDIKVLVATDVAGRGIHVSGVSHVVNYNLPEDPEDYVHRIGRTGRAGATGISISFACEDEAFLLPDIEQLLGEKLECTYPPQEWLD